MDHPYFPLLVTFGIAAVVVLLLLLVASKIGPKSINAVKAVEIGAGFEAVAWGGERNADEIRIDENGQSQFQSNNAGGILGGISTGQDIVVRVGFKPTSSILQPVKTIDKYGQETDIITKGRHDPCVGLRGAPIAEAMMACVLADHWLRHKAQCL